MINPSFKIQSSALLVEFIRILSDLIFSLTLKIYNKNQQKGFLSHDFLSDAPNTDPNHWRKMLSQAPSNQLSSYLLSREKKKDTKLGMLAIPLLTLELKQLESEEIDLGSS